MSQAILFAGFCVASFFLAALLSLLLEAPVVSLLSAARKTRAPTAPRATAPRPIVPPMPASWKTAGFGY
jgi:peptidoglycan/LPS O-acetylase OafA/YrhL